MKEFLIAALKTLAAAIYIPLTYLAFSAGISILNAENGLLPFIPVWALVTFVYFYWKGK